MPCYRPIKAFRRESGDIAFTEAPRDLESLELGCGRCVGCRLGRASSWSVRCMHEASLYDRNCFVTLTYDDEHLPEHGSLKYEDVQAFLKRLRRRKRGFAASPTGKYPIRFFTAGEYGSESWRPHYHMLLFNFDFEDKSRFGEKTFRSDLLEELWPLGSSLLGAVTPASAAYVARYSLKKVMGRQAAADFYTWIDSATGEVHECKREFCVPSRRPGIGAWWYSKYASDVMPRDYVVSEGRKSKVPRYYAEKFKLSDPYRYDEIKEARYEKLRTMPLCERTPERRLATEAVQAAALDHFHQKRGL